MKYDYKKHVKHAIINHIKENYNNLDEVNESLLYDDLWIDDAVTGNASGSYYCNAYKAEEALAHNLDLLKVACEEFDCIPDLASPEACDVTIRCYLLGECMYDALEELKEEGF